ncbi:hypothetical protein NCCP2331_08880 [Sporosarcina sp. NCCP-2331]|nr:hypothetical protein NCCP2331_08880 [Sporosarcina sp. NCCP-2331]GLB54845.1 hypothetical protein NCCP2378_06300 [Sporosarcina sp. NCCP-2378]
MFVNLEKMNFIPYYYKSASFDDNVLGNRIDGRYDFTNELCR